MDCHVCELTQRKFYCTNCIRTHIRDIRAAIEHVAQERKEQIEKATKLLATIQDARLARADSANVEERLNEIQTRMATMRIESDTRRARIAALRTSLSTRRATLLSARSLPSHSGALSASLSTFNAEFAEQTAKIALTRSVLVKELVDAFAITEIDITPPPGTRDYLVKTEWTIAGVVLPVPGDIKRYPSEQIDAALTHTLHFIRCLTFYLGVKLPFDVSWSGGLMGVGRPSIMASRGTDSGGWAKWTAPHPLHVSPLPSPSSPATVSSQSFPTALAMLAYNVAYLAHTQDLSISLSQSPEILRNIWAICYSPDLGYKSHDMGHISGGSHDGIGMGNLSDGLLPAPTPPTFPLDFEQLLQVMIPHPRQHRHDPHADDTDDWHLIDHNAG